MDFNNSISQSLIALSKNDVVLHYPFFANTFPLPYFYSQLLKKHNKDINKYILEVDWNDSNWEVGTFNNSSYHLFFGIKNKFQLSNGNVGVKAIEFTKYFPRYIFTEFSSEIINILELNHSHENYWGIKRNFSDIDFNQKFISISNFLTKATLDKLGASKVLILTDTDNEAESIKKLFSSLPIHIIKNNERNLMLNSSFLGNDVLKLYFFSAPYNIYFLKEHFQYIPFVFHPKEVEEKFVTNNYLIYYKNKNEEIVEDISKEIATFHKAIFHSAFNYPENLTEVFSAYNNLSRANEPLEIFDTVHSYSKCLALHSLDEIDQIRQDDIWLNIYHSNSRSNYARDLVLLNKNVASIYTVLSLHYLIKTNDDSISNNQYDDYKEICRLLKDNLLNDGVYYVWFKDFIKIKVLDILLKYKEQQGSIISQALDKNISLKSILHNLSFKIEEMFFESNFLDCIPANILKVNKDGVFTCHSELKTLQEFLSDKKTKIAIESKSNLIESLNMIIKFYDEIISLCKEDMQNEQTYFGQKLKDSKVIKAINNYTLPKGSVKPKTK